MLGCFGNDCQVFKSLGFGQERAVGAYMDDWAL